MKEAHTPPRLGQPGLCRQTFRDGETVLLTVKADWPQLEGESIGAKRIGRYCDALAKHWQKRWEGPLLKAAKAAAGPDTPPWSAGMDFKVTLLREDLFSFYLDIWEDVGLSRPRRLRLGETWRLPEGVPLTLKEVLTPGGHWRRDLLAEVRRQIEERLTSGESLFHADWPRQTAARFSPQRFYCTEAGPCLFYPVDAIAPSLEGFPTFPLKNEKSTCFFP